ncbi:hypothetical protein MHU86_4676 [Fragilaria crotonensis]|nr:hypothetical protein MHU86_4676 [Fragilaria crotonensis]
MHIGHSARVTFAALDIRTIFVTNKTVGVAIDSTLRQGMPKAYVGIQKDCIAQLVEEVLRAQPFFRQRIHALNSSPTCDFKSVWIPYYGGICITHELLPSIDNPMICTLSLDVLLKHIKKLRVISRRSHSIQASKNKLNQDNANGIYIIGCDIGTWMPVTLLLDIDCGHMYPGVPNAKPPVVLCKVTVNDPGVALDLSSGTNLASPQSISVAGVKSSARQILALLISR